MNAVEEVWIYFARAGLRREVKIGYSSKDPVVRLREQNTGNSEDLVLLKTVRGPRQLEADYHERFKAHHIRREWFRLEGDLAAFLEVAPDPPARKRRPTRRPEPISSSAAVRNYPFVSIQKLGYHEFLRRCARRLEITGSLEVRDLIEPETFRAELRPMAIRFQSSILRGSFCAWSPGVLATSRRQKINARKIRKALNGICERVLVRPDQPRRHEHARRSEGVHAGFS